MYDFFNNYPEFYKTTKTIPSSNRLNTRYEAMIASNKGLVNQRSILDLASHDGRWSFAAIKNGAKYVLGIEARRELFQSSMENMKKYHMPDNTYSFVCGDIFEEIKKIKQNAFDIVFCFGYFYHTMNHAILLSEIKRIHPMYLFLDTAVCSHKEPVIEIHKEDPQDPRNAASGQHDSNNHVLVGTPSKKALELLLSDAGFSFEYYDWHNSTIEDWKDIEDYHDNLRVTLVAKNLN